MILLDTSVLSRVFRRAPPGPAEGALERRLAALMARGAPLGLPGIVLQEVLSGIRAEKQFADLERRLLTSFAIVHPSTADYVEAARLRNRCAAKGLNVSGTDCLISTMAIAADHQLLAVDRDFEAIAKLEPLRLWRR